MEINPTDQLEYNGALDFYKQYTEMRRKDMAFITTAQGAVLTIIGDKLLNMNISYFLLSLVATFLLFIGLNSERRFASYMKAYMVRARDIEKKYEMSLLSDAYTHVTKTKTSLSNTKTFPVYYGLFIFVWMIIWISNFIIWVLSFIICPAYTPFLFAV